MEFINVKLSDIGEVVGGSTPSTKNIDNYDGNIAWITPKDLAGYNKVYISSGERNITEAGFKSCSTKMLPKNSVLFSSRAPIGYVAISENDLCTNQGFKSIIPNEKVDYKFLYYLLKHNKDYIASKGSGSTFKEVSGSVMKGIELSIPKDINDQRRISKVLFDIDKKIELNNEINNNLYEVSKQLLLKYLEDNSNFEEINISELLNVFTGKKNANETSPNGKYKFFSCAPESLLSDTYLYDEAAIIVAGNGAYTGRTRFYDGKFELYQRTYGLTLKDNLNKNNIYGLYVFMKTIFEPDKMGGTHGSAIPYIVLSDLTDYKLKYNKIEFNKFSDLVSNNIKMIQENEKANEELSQLRDTLLLKLMNGEIDLDNIEI